jgi:hypothetical protein
MTIDQLLAKRRLLQSELRQCDARIRHLSRGATKSKQPKRDTKCNYEARVWHDQVFALHGSQCYWCGGVATEAAHVIARGMSLGNKRYCTPLLGVPVCHPCHELETLNKLSFPLDIRQVAMRGVNRRAKIQRTIPRV